MRSGFGPPFGSPGAGLLFLMQPKNSYTADPENFTAKIAAESTQESTPHKSLYGDRKTRETPARQPKPAVRSRRTRKSS